MKILLITEWFPPIRGAAAKRTEMMAKGLVSGGHDVTVITSFPSYPTGILPKKYHWKLWTKEKENGYEVIRVWELPTANKGIFKRILREISFFLSSAITALILPAYNAAIVSSPSFLSGLSGLCAKREGCEFYFDVRDLWPDTLVGLKVLKPGIILNLLKTLESFYYRQAKKIIVATPGIQKHLFLEGIPLNKIELLYNSADTNLFKPKKSLRPKEIKEDDFVVTYVGNHSPIYNLENAIKAAKLVPSKCKFIFIGEGETKNDLLNLSERLKLKNTLFYQEQPLEKIANILAWSNVGLVSLDSCRAAQTTFPSKIAEYLASGLPIIATAGHDVKKVIEKNNVGVICNPSDEKELARVIKKLSKNKNLLQKMSKNARQLALKTFSESNFNQKLLKIIS